MSRYLLMIPLMLAACAPNSFHPAVTASSQLWLDKSTVSQVSDEHYVFFTPGAATLEADSTLPANILSRPEAVAQVTITPPVSDALRSKRVGALYQTLRRAGVPASRIQVVANGQSVPDGYALMVTQNAITPPPCPDWSADPTGTVNNVPFSNLGCATANNITQMVADPADLVGNSAMVPMDGGRNAMVVQRYRSDTATAAPSAGPVSALGATGGEK